MTDQLQPSAMAREAMPSVWQDACYYLDYYAEYIRSVHSSEIERHPYLPDLERVAEEMRALPEQALKHAMPEREAIAPDAEKCAVSEDAIRHLEIRSNLNRTIYKAVRDYRMSNMWDEDGCGFPLIDLMSNEPPADIGSGEMEMVALVDDIETAILSLTGDVREAAPERGLRELWQKVSDELDHIPGGMHADLEDAASALWTAFDSSASPPAAPDMREALEKIARGSECGLADFKDQMTGRKAPNWRLVNILQDNLAACRGTAAAALASSPMDAVKAAVEDEWQDISTAPKDGTLFLAALRVRNKESGAEWIERHAIAVDDETGEIASDFEQGWRLEDYEIWHALPDASTAIRSRGEGEAHGR